MNPATDTVRPLARMVLDTNVVLDLWWFDDPRVARLKAALEARQVVWIACPAMRAELAHVLGRGLAPSRSPIPIEERTLRAAEVLAHWDRLVQAPLLPDPPAVSRLRCSDPQDQVFIELALQQQANWLLSADRALLKLARRARLRGLHIAPARDWNPAEWLDAHDPLDPLDPLDPPHPAKPADFAGAPA